MDTAKKIIDFSIVIMLSNALEKLASIVTTFLLARYLGLDSFGLYSFVFSIAILLNSIGDMGINTFFFREINNRPELVRHFFTQLFPAKLLLFIFSIVVSVVVFFIFDFNTAILVWLAIVSFVVYSFGGFFNQILYCFDEMKNILLANFFYRFVFFSVILASIFFDFKIIGAVFANLLGAVFFTFINFFLILNRGVLKNIKINFSNTKNAFISAIPFSVNLTIQNFYSKIGFMMLFNYFSVSAVGIYSAAIRLVESLAFLPVSFNSSIYVFMTRSYNIPQKSDAILEYGLKFLMILFVPASIGITLLSDRIIDFFYGAEFLQASFPLQIVSWYFLVNSVNLLLIFHLNSLRKEIYVTKILCISASVAFFISLLIIPILSYSGAAISLLLSEVIIFLFIFCKKELKFKKSVIYFFIKPLFFSIPMIIFITNFYYLNLLAIVIISILLYFFVFYFFGFSSTERFFFNNIFIKVFYRKKT